MGPSTWRSNQSRSSVVEGIRLHPRSNRKYCEKGICSLKLQPSQSTFGMRPPEFHSIARLQSNLPASKHGGFRAWNLADVAPTPKKWPAPTPTSQEKCRWLITAKMTSVNRTKPWDLPYNLPCSSIPRIHLLICPETKLDIKAAVLDPVLCVALALVAACSCCCSTSNF